MVRSLKLLANGSVIELEDDQLIQLTGTGGQVDRLINTLLFSQTETFTVVTSGNEPAVPRGEPRGSTRKTNQSGIERIKHFEDCELTAYQDSVGVWTIGYGYTGGVSKGDKITQAQAEQLLQKDLERFETAVVDAVKVAIDDNQFSALVSFTFNLGPRNLLNSTLLKRLHQGDVVAAANEFPKWNKAGGQVLRGLTRRRNAERALFLGQSWGSFSDQQEITVRILKLTDPNMEVEDVRQVQAALVKVGFDIKTDGVFG
jgi:lysozyme